MGLYPQRPKKLAYEQQPAGVREWLGKTYPAIARRAKAEKVEILWGDETGTRNQDHAVRGYALAGKTPLVRGMAKRVTTRMISAIGNRGDVRFMIFNGGAKRKIFLIEDNLRVQKARRVTEWVAERANRIELFFLPP